MARAIVCLGGEPETDLGKLQAGRETLTMAGDDRFVAT